ncbi:MAG: hypothetical protein ACLFWL_12995 [Candidatus Brocadiia bacterium]
MTQLAVRSEGNHFFAENATDLRKGFDLEFSIGMAVVAQEVTVQVKCGEGVRPVRILNADGNVKGNKVIVGMNQIYSGREAGLLVELNVPATAAGKHMKIADVEVTYANMQTKTTDRLTSELRARFVEDPETVKRKRRKDVIVAVAEQEAMEKNMKAVELRDKGKVEEAQKILRENAKQLDNKAEELDSKALAKEAQQNREDAEQIADDESYRRQRKDMRDRQSEKAAPAVAF